MDKDKFYENKQLKSLMSDTKRFLLSKGIAPGDILWIIENACHDCPNAEDHCGLDCDIKDKKYLREVSISKVIIEVGEKDNYNIKLIDMYGREYTVDQFDETVFTDRMDAISKL